MECVIRVIKGPDAGQAAKLPPGATMVGRSTSAGLRLSAPEVSWEHLVITRTGEDYTAENLSSHGTWYDGNKMTGPIRLRQRDQLKLGETILRLEPAEGLGINRTRLLAVALVAMLLAAVGLVIYQQISAGPKRTDDWARAYAVVEMFLEAEAARGTVAKEAVPVLRQAWRQEQALDYEHSRETWLRLKMILDSSPARDLFLSMTGEAQRKAALQRILTLPKESAGMSVDDTYTQANPEQLGAATMEFINRRLNWAITNSKKSSSSWFK